MAVQFSSLRNSKFRATGFSPWQGCALGTLAFCLAFAPQLALADNECGAATGPTVTCTSAGNNYGNGVTYIAPPQDLTIILNPDVVIDTTGSLNIGVLAVTDPTLSISLSADTGAAITTGDQGAYGVLLGTTAGNVSATTTTITTSGDGADAIIALADTGSVTVSNSSSIDTSGVGANGITASTGTGAINASGFTVVTHGDNAAGFNLDSQNGNVTATLARGIFGGTVLTSGANATGVFANAGGTGNVSVVGNGAGGFGPSAVVTSGAGSTGVLATADAGTVNVDLSQVQTTGAGADAIMATSAAGGVTVNVSTVTADDGRGIVANGSTSAAVTQSGNFIGTGGDNHAAVTVLAANGPASATIGTAFTSGANSNAVNVTSTTGEATASTGGTTTSGDNSVAVLATGSTGATITSASARTTGANSAALHAVSGAGTDSVPGPDTLSIASIGTALITSTGEASATGAGSTAIIADGGDAVVNNSGVAAGNVDGIMLTSTNTGTLTNSGTISSGTGYAIRAVGGAATVTNSGTINGRIVLTDNADTVTNSGVFNASQSSDLGAGNDVFTNSGSIFVVPNTVAAGTVSFTNLETLNNSGTIDLRNGHTDDAFNLGSAAFVGAGASALGLDVNLGGTPTTDQLITGAATGSTVIVVNNLTTGTPVLNPGIILVQGGAGSTASAFSLAGGSINAGFVSYGLNFNPGTNSYSLVGAPSISALRTVKIVDGARSLWYKSADAWSGHMSALRDATWRSGGEGATETPGSGFWLQMFGSSDKRRNGTQTFTNLGTTTTADLGYRQDAFGGQIGFDLGAPKPAGGLVFGLTGGYLNSTLHFGGAERIQYDAINGGAYASFISGSFFANVLGKYDYYWLDSRLAGGANSRNIHGHSYGAQGEAGIRFGGSTFFAEPVASIAYVKTRINDLVTPGFTFNMDDRDGLRGKAGLRIGSSTLLGGSTGLVYASGMAVHEFQGRDNVSVVSGGQTVNLRNERIGTYGQGTIGFNMTTPGGVTGFIEAFGDYGDDYRGGGGRAGLRYHF